MGFRAFLYGRHICFSPASLEHLSFAKQERPILVWIGRLYFALDREDYAL
jgi:hypothetical protein